MRTPIYLGERTVVLISSDNFDDIDMDEVTKIDYSNLYGEAVTCSALLNRIGLLKADAEAVYNIAKIECNVYEAGLKKRFRKEALLGGGRLTLEDNTTIKLTENGLEEIILLDKGYQEKSKALVYAKRDLDYLESLNWAISSKDRKLNNLLPKTTPEEFFDHITEGVINTFTIKKMP